MRDFFTQNTLKDPYYKEIIINIDPTSDILTYLN